MQELKDKVAIITGGSGDIGAATAEEFIKEGARAVIIADIDLEKAEKICSNLQTGQLNECIAVKTDVTCQEDIKNLFNITIEKYGRLDILVNCAGICPVAYVDDIGEKEWDRVMDINLKGTYLCCREAVFIMREKKYGKIINLSSIAGRMGGIVTGVHYASSKGAIITLTKSFAKLFGTYNININCLAPGTIESEMTRKWDNSWKKNILKDIPLGRFGTPLDVANAIVFMASEKSDFLNGAIIDLNGGAFSG
jgi:3-oxoacyl-[acyl-carrier protein] reductase